MALVDNGSDLLGMFGMAESLPRSPGVSKPLLGGLMDTPVPARLPPLQKPSAPTPKPIGCAIGSDTKTVVVAGNFEGDSTRLGVVMQQSRRVAAGAAARGNRVVYAFLGNVLPRLHDSSSDAGLEGPVDHILKMAQEGIVLGQGVRVAPDDVLMLSGPSELAWLRLANSNASSREISAFDDPLAREVLTRGAPATLTKQAKSYNKSLWLFDVVEDEDGVSVAMMLKLLSMTNLTMKAQGLVPIFLRRLQRQGSHDEASVASLLSFVSNFQGTVEEGMAKLFNGGRLTPEGVGLQPAAKALVATVVDFARDLATRYTRHSKLVHFVTNGDSTDAEGGLWLVPRGVHYTIGKLASGVDEAGVKWEDGPQDKLEWTRAINKDFRHFVKDLLKGDDSVSVDKIKAYAALSVESENNTPLAGLGSLATCSGVTCSSELPFGTIQQRRLVKDAYNGSHSRLVRVLDQWASITDASSSSTYWSVATWCGSTRVELSPVAPPLDLHERLSSHLRNVSVVLASLLTARVGDKSVAEFGVGDLGGVVGPVVVAEKQQMRAISFAHTSFDTVFVALLPEAFVRWSLDYLEDDIDLAMTHGTPFLATEGFMALPDENVVPLGFPGIPASDVEALRAELGNRVWSIPRKRSNGAHYTAAEYASITYMSTAGNETSRTTPGFCVYRTTQNSVDPLDGVTVSLAPVPGMANRMTITTSKEHAKHVVHAVELQEF